MCNKSSYKTKESQRQSPKVCVIAMENSSLLRLLVVLLGFSYLICLNAVPTTRTINIMLESDTYRVSENSHMENAEESLEAGGNIRRMELQLNDYAPPGANPRHNPPPKSP
ncbi:unnamed protein product [Camellia sinensis]